MWRSRRLPKSSMRFSAAGHTTYQMCALTKYRVLLYMKVTGAMRALLFAGTMSMVRELEVVINLD